MLAKLERLITAGNDRADAGFKAVKADMDLLGGQFESLERDVRGLQSWRVRTEDRQALNSLRAQATSSVDLEQDAKLATALTQLAEEKAKFETLEKNAATKDDLKKITEAQTSAIVEAVKGIAAAAEKSPTARALLLAFAGLLFVCITAATNYVTTRAAQVVPQQTKGTP